MTRWRGRIRLGLRLASLTVLFGGPAGLTIGWLMFQHKPTWYQPVEANGAVLRRAQEETASLANSISDQIVRGKPFDVTLTDANVNAWLAALPQLYPDARNVMPPELTELAVGFVDGELRIGAFYEGAQWRTIVNSTLHLAVSENRKEVSIGSAGIRGGSLPIPRWLLEELLDRHGRRWGRDKRGASASGERIDMPFSEITSVDDLIEGVVVPNRFVWPNGQRPFRIASIAMGEGQLRLRIEPQ